MTPQLDPDPGIEYPTNTGQNPVDLDELVLLKDKVTIHAFASQIVHIQTQKMFIKGHHLNVMIQPLYLEDKVKMPIGLYVQRVYTEMKDGSQNISTVLHNGTGKPIHLAAGWLVDRIVAAKLCWMQWHHWNTRPSWPKTENWEVLMLVDSEAAARVSGAAETVDYFG